MICDIIFHTWSKQHMSEIKTEIKPNADGSYTITDAHSTADIVRWLLTQDSKETIMYLLGVSEQRKWVSLTTDQKLSLEIQGSKSDVMLAELVEQWLKEMNT
jgi:hypothetical protein